MNKLIVISALSLFVVFSGFAQTKDVKGPKYKNTRPSDRNEGNSAILIKEDPNQFQGPRLKNFNPMHYEIEIKDSIIIEEKQNNDLVVSTESKVYGIEEGKEKIIYRKVDTKDMQGKNTKGLKGPAYKNYRQ